MKKSISMIMGLTLTVMFLLCGCGSDGSEGTAAPIGGSKETPEKASEKASKKTPLEDAEEAADLMEEYEMGAADAGVMARLEKTESEIVDEGFLLLCGRYVEKYKEEECVQYVTDAWEDFGKYLSPDNSFAKLLDRMVTGYQTEQFGINTIEERYANIEDLGEALNIWSNSFYVQYRIKTADDTIIGFLEKNLADAPDDTPEVYYYYANDVVYNSLLQSYGAGDVEYVLMSPEPFAQAGAQNVYVVATGTTMKLESAQGFVRDVNVYECISVAQAEQMIYDYDNYYSYYWGLKAREGAIYQILTRVTASEEEQDAFGTASMPQGDDSPEEIYVGTWSDIDNPWCFMTITCEEQAFRIEINWGGNGMRENTRWSLGGWYNEEEGGIYYTGVCQDQYMKEDGTVETSYRYEDGSGFLCFYDGIGLFWEDNRERAGAGCIFVKSSDDVE
ncbi:MAG: hypothetical protein NC094_04135 [Bacteroidales bacterium]|nr:hypothetical protein [Lachnoclostridium sp.]MCM1383188.1 hypothetical protein [Lachnoclostridium sp.]MCM1464586.1 hypothetical protein [Bacteroidales bacterium]